MRVSLAMALASVAVNAAAEPLITASAAIVLDAESGRTLFARGADARRFPASTTKILTALLLLEHCDALEEIRAPLDVEQVGGSSLHLEPAERVRAEDVLHALLLRSANDAAYAVAVHIAGSQEAFAEMMNARAKQIGCTGSHFTNPHGLHDPAHYTTARDLALITREALRNERFLQAAKATRRVIWRSTNLEDTVLVSKNRLLAVDPDAIGVKTGYTKPAGHCFVGARTRDGWTAIVVVLDSADWLQDTQALLDWAFTEHRIMTLVAQGERIASAVVVGGERDSVGALAAHEVRAALALGEGVLDTCADVPSLSAPVRKGEEVGKLRVRLSGGEELTVPLIASESVPFASGRSVPFQWLWATLAISLVAVGVALLARARNG